MEEADSGEEMTPEALLALRERAAAGDVQALFELGWELDDEEGTEYLRRAAESG